MYIDCIWPFTTFISRNKHKKTHKAEALLAEAEGG